MTDGTSYEGKGFQQFGFEYNKGFQGDGGRTDQSPEPMYVILNLGISNKFQTVEWEKLNFPAKMYIDYVRIYQREGHTNIGCSPKAGFSNRSGNMGYDFSSPDPSVGVPTMN
ncbi:hypothetical protein PGT21_002894 [Puccinia graminis f. sp. tritici]|uniref:GH16 domain-containing protein n=1 Tax=Puccinia graminis f. sp. tritici TaxID=56615 RepID=A0A5B0PF93_PUCGR|nr:hypothetical protein PGT21_002894 [Puccinia graminis f. sp. tritici]